MPALLRPILVCFGVLLCTAWFAPRWAVAEVAAPAKAAPATPVTAKPAPAAPAPKSPPDPMAAILASPMIFYLAKGEADVCGAGCNEWIAAEGSIDLAAAQRLRALLARLGKRKLPIYFHSPGGLGGIAMEIGRILRE